MMVCATELRGTCNGALKGITSDQQHQCHLFRSEGKQSQGSSQPPLFEFAFPVTCAGQDRQGCSEIPLPLRGGRQINCLTIPSGQTCMLLARDLTNRPLSEHSTRHSPPAQAVLCNSQKKKKKRNKGKKSDVILIAHPSLQKPPETGGINLKTTQCYHHPSRRHPNATPPCSLFCKPLSQCFFSLLNRQQRFASLCVKKHKVVGIFLSLTFFGSLNGKILANETLINGKS